MARKLAREEFIIRAKKQHGAKYDYSKVVYSGAHEKVSIICPEHGEFLQLANDHFRGKGCPQCAHIRSAAASRSSAVEFIERAQKTHGDRYDYSLVVYKNSKNKVMILCPEHGEFCQTPNTHLMGYGCAKCGGTMQSTTEEFITKAQTTHHNRYGYDLVEYKGSKNKVTIICPEHGEFCQTPNNHLRGKGCKKCASMNNTGAYSFEFFEKTPAAKDVPATLYIIKLHNHEESFFKIGITTRTVVYRFYGHLPYEYEILETTPMSLYAAFIKEQELLKSAQRYYPQKKFPGYTECITEPPVLTKNLWA